MSHLLTPLARIEVLFVPALLVTVAWAIWRIAVRKDLAVGLAFYISLVVVVDGFYNTGIFIPGFAAGSIRYSEVCAAALLLIWWRKPSSPRQPSVIPLLVAGYFFLIFLSVLQAKPLMAGVFDFRRIIVPQILAYFLGRRCIETPDDFRRFVLGIGGLALVVGVFCLWDVLFDRWILHSDLLFSQEYSHNRRVGRFGSLFLNPNFLGAFVVLALPSMFIATLKERSLRARLFLLVSSMGLAFCLVETQSRGPLLAFAGVALLLMLGPVGGMSRPRRIAAMLVFAALLSVAMPGFFEHSSRRFTSANYDDSSDVRSRASVWSYTRRLIEEHPLRGVGFGEGQFLRAMAKTDFRERYGEVSLDNPHNSYLQAAVYAGLPAVVLFLLVNVVALVKFALRMWLGHAPAALTSAAFGLAVSTVGFLVCIFPDMHLFTATVAPVYWLLFGLLTTMLSPALQPRPRGYASMPYVAKHAHGGGVAQQDGLT